MQNASEEEQITHIAESLLRPSGPSPIPRQAKTRKFGWTFNDLTLEETSLALNNLNLLQATTDFLRGKRHNYCRGMLLCDIKGAFNSAKRTPMTEAMEELGFPQEIIKFTTSFMADRRIKPHRNGVYGKEIIVPEGLPQGSPLSPVLFAILIADIGREDEENPKIYVDDIQITESTKGLTFRKAEKTITEVIRKFRNKGLEIDPSKNEFLVVGANAKEAKTKVDGIVVENQDQVKYLGIAFDHNLTFLPHLSNRTTAATQAAWGIMQLNKVTGGVSPKSISTYI